MMTFLSQAVEQFTIEQLVAKLGVEALAISSVGITLHWGVLSSFKVPRRARLDEGAPCAHRSNPFPHGFSHELRPLVGASMTRCAVQDEEVR